MSWRVSAAIAAGAFALGVFVASAPAVLGQSPPRGDPGMAEMGGHMAAGDHMAGMRSMMTMMSGSMMGPGGSSMPMAPGVSTGPIEDARHRAHHPDAGPGAVR